MVIPANLVKYQNDIKRELSLAHGIIHQQNRSSPVCGVVLINAMTLITSKCHVDKYAV